MTTDSRHRLGLLAVTALSLFAALFARLWVLQVVEGDSLTLQAEGNATQEVITPAPRGNIYDRNGVPLVQNRESIVVGIDLEEFAELSEGRQRGLKQRLAEALSYAKVPVEQVTVEQIDQKLNDARFSQFRPIPIAEDLTVEDEIYFSEQADRFPSVVVERTTVREYPYGSLAAHVLGYVGPLSDAQWEELSDDNDPDKPYIQTDEIGKAGVEATYEEQLRGTPGRQVFEVDRRGRVVRELMSERVEPRPGDDLYLSIDARVQYKAEEALQAQLLNAFQGDAGREAGGLVVMDHTTGQVRAMASYPTYDPSELVGGIPCPVWRDLQGLAREGSCGDELTDEIAELREAGTAPVPKLLNRAIQGEYFPASTFKLASAYAALKTGVRTPESTIADQGFVRFCKGDGPGCVKTNANDTPYGSVALAKSLTVSSDVYYYLVGAEIWARREQLGEAAFQEAVADLGYGTDTGIDLPGERSGRIPTPEDEMDLAMALFESNPEAYDNDIDNARDAGRWRTGFSADIAIGQKLTATPLQTANAYAALANGGTLWQPSVLDRITSAGEPDDITVAHEPVALRQVDFGAAREDFLWGFRGVVDPTGQNDRGTAVTTFDGFPFGAMPLAGKTGTAQNGEDPESGIERPDTSLFAAFSTGGESAWTAAAVLEFSGSGGSAAAPAIRLVLEPIADGSIFQFQVPRGGAIDAEAAAADAAAIGTSTTD
jgi:penicillin-binding protein 2